MITSVLKCGDGRAETFPPVIVVDVKTRLDLDDYGDGRLALWIGWPIAMKIEMSRAVLERLYSFLGAALQELDMAAAAPALIGSCESEAVCE